MNINLNTASREQLKQAAQMDARLAKVLGDIEGRDIETLRTVAEMYFALNTEVGAFYDKNGF